MPYHSPTNRMVTGRQPVRVCSPSGASPRGVTPRAKPGVALTVWRREDGRAFGSLRHPNQSWAPLAIVFRSDLQIAPPLDGTEPFPPKGVGEGLLRPDPERVLVEGQVDVPTSLYRRDEPCDVEGPRPILVVQREDSQARSVRQVMVNLRPDVCRIVDPRVEVRRVEHEEPARSKVSAEGPETPSHVGWGGEVVESGPEAQERVEGSSHLEASHVRDGDVPPEARFAEVPAGCADHLGGEIPPHDRVPSCHEAEINREGAAGDVEDPPYRPTSAKQLMEGRGRARRPTGVDGRR